MGRKKYIILMKFGEPQGKGIIRVNLQRIVKEIIIFV